MKKIIYAFVFFLISIPAFVFAQSGDLINSGDPDTSIKLPNPTGFDTISDVLERVISYLTQLAIPILTIMVMIGAFYMLTARDDESKFTKGKKTITYAVIGFAIILIGNGFVFIIKEFMGVQ